MKQGTLITRIVILVLFAGVSLYMGAYAVRSLSNPFTTVIAYQDEGDNAVEAAGVLIREELVLESAADIMDVLPGEGERVAAGETVAILYQNSAALEREKQLRSLQQEKQRLQYALESGGDLGDAAQLEQQIIGSVLSLRTAAAQGNLSSLDSDALSLRTLVLQQQFAYSASGDSAAALTEAMADLDGEIAQLQAQATYDTSSVRAPCSGLFSGATDHLEDTLTPAALESMTAGQLRAVLDAGAPAAVQNCVGKLITGERWYFAALVDAGTAAGLLPGDQLTAAFSRDFTGEVDMRVERVGQEEAEGCVLVLSSDRHLKDVTLLREQTVLLIFERFSGIRVPKQALRMEAAAQDSEGDAGAQTIGVYTVVGLRAEFKPVEIVWEGGDYYLVKPAQDAGERLLRAGDEIIVSASGLYDGKVVLE